MMTPADRLWLPYCGAAPAPSELVARWNVDPVMLTALAAAAALLWRVGETRSQRRFAAGAALLAVLLFVSPFCALSSALFSARVSHHVLLAAALAPLVALAVPERRLRVPGSVAAWTVLQAVTFWLSHVPGVYAAALSSDVLYWAMQLTIAGTAACFWVALRRASGLSAVAALLVTTVQMGLLGALITFAPEALYAPHMFTTQAWGLTALDDQQLAGLIMWAPAAALYLAAALGVAWRRLADDARELSA